MHVKFNYSQISDKIYVGTNMCCQTHFDEELLKKKVSADISLEKEKIDAAQGVDYYLWIPVADHEAPTQKQLHLGVTAMNKMEQMGDTIYVHCKNGHGRSPTLVAAYLINEGKSLEDSIKLIQEKRPEIHVEDVQMEALKQYEDEHKG